jgi:hypothetical protein
VLSVLWRLLSLSQAPTVAGSHPIVGCSRSVQPRRVTVCLFTCVARDVACPLRLRSGRPTSRGVCVVVVFLWKSTGTSRALLARRIVRDSAPRSLQVRHRFAPTKPMFPSQLEHTFIGAWSRNPEASGPCCRAFGDTFDRLLQPTLEFSRTRTHAPCCYRTISGQSPRSDEPPASRRAPRFGGLTVIAIAMPRVGVVFRTRVGEADPLTSRRLPRPSGSVDRSGRARPRALSSRFS